MFVISKKTGQLCNQLFLFSNIITIGIETNREVLNPSFYENSSYFKGTKGNKFSRFPRKDKKSIFSEKYLSKFLKWYVHLFPLFVFSTYKSSSIKFILAKAIKKNYSHYDEKGLYFDREDSDGRIEKFKTGKIKLINGFMYLNSPGMKRNRQILCDFFEPCDEYKSKPDQFLKELKKNYELLIGLHIRRGDYRSYRDGRYYYSDDDYRKVIKNLEECFVEKKIKILIVSDENVNSTLIEGNNVSHFGGNMIEDLYLLSECDFIIGPPSTYSKWASFYGEKPLYVLETTDMKISVDEFNVRYNHYN